MMSRWARKLSRVAQACLRLAVAAVVVGAGVVYFSFGSLSPFSILREAIRQRDDFAAVLPDGVIDFVLETQFGQMSANRCSLVLLNELDPLQPGTKQTSLRQPLHQPTIRSIPTCGHRQCRH